MAERRGRRLSLSCRLFFFGEDDFEGEATVLDLSTGRLSGDVPYPGAGWHGAPPVPVPSRPAVASYALIGPLVRWVKGANFGLEFHGRSGRPNA